ncbi:MAG: acetate--CoA ligase family protein, partial [Deltaproteobacteria bacterium]|nr:acetate--CoA ligase family protein [Deltaproteobacteria bacterium]
MIDPQRLIDTALSEERPALADADAKALLANHGIPLVPEARVQSVAEAAEAARRTGFPVVLKGYGPNLLHKTEQGLVRPGLASAEAVAAAAEAMAQSAGAQLEGFLVQPQVEGRREFVAGIFRDAQFGPVILFGLGGVFTEALADVALRLAPLTRQDAAAMLAEIRARRLWEAFRGE